MSKQYLTTHATTTPSPSNRSDVFAVGASRCISTLLVATGGSTLHVYSTASSSYPLIQTLPKAHPLGTHHLATSDDGRVAVSVGFGGEVKIWRVIDSALDLTGDAASSEHQVWRAAGEIRQGLVGRGKKKNAGECWAISLNESGRWLAGTSFDGKVRVWDLEGRVMADGEVDMFAEENEQEGVRLEPERSGTGEPTLVHEVETRGGFGMACDISADGSLLASAHQSGALYLFALSTSRARLLRSLPSLHAPARTVRFSPAGTLLAAAGDSGHIALYSISQSGSNGFDGQQHFFGGDQIAILKGHNSWITSLAWSSTGEWIASCAWDGRVRVWSTERRECVSTLKGPETPGEGTAGSGGDGGPCWTISWLPSTRTSSKVASSEGFVVGGRKGGLKFLREAAGG